MFLERMNWRNPGHLGVYRSPMLSAELTMHKSSELVNCSGQRLVGPREDSSWSSTADDRSCVGEGPPGARGRVHRRKNNMYLLEMKRGMYCTPLEALRKTVINTIRLRHAMLVQEWVVKRHELPQDSYWQQIFYHELGSCCNLRHQESVSLPLKERHA